MEVVELDRANRQMRRRRGKTDAVDAEAAARAVLRGEATAQPKSADGCVEAIRALAVARRCAVKARAVAANQIDALVVTAAERLQRQLRALPEQRLINACARLRPTPLEAPPAPPPNRPCGHWPAATRRSTARSTPSTPSYAASASRESRSAERSRRRPRDRRDAAHRRRRQPPQDAQRSVLASLWGTNPAEASSGPKARHRLNRRRNPQTNNTLRRTTTARPRVDQHTTDHAPRRNTQSKTRREIPRCTKRHITPETYRLLTDPPKVPHRANLRQHRLQAGITLTAAAHAPDTAPARISTLQTGLIHNTDLSERYHHWLTQLPT